MLFSSTGMLKLGLIANYLVDYEYYVTELCKNKDKPELSCNGSCAFMEEMGLVEGSDQEKPEAPEIQISISPFQITPLYSFQNAEYTSTRSTHIHAPGVLIQGYPLGLIKPPADIFCG